MALSDQEIIADLLVDNKYISTGYHNAVLEAATDRVRNTLLQIQNDELAAHKKLFDFLYSRGYYQVEPAIPAGTAVQFQQGMQVQPAGLQSMGNVAGTAAGNMQESPMGTAGMGAAQQNFSQFPYTAGQNINRNQPGVNYGTNQNPLRNW